MSYSDEQPHIVSADAFAQDQEGAVIAEQVSDTARLEAFSDGVFAVAITLLVLNLQVPPLADAMKNGLWTALLNNWAAFLAYIISFIFILVMWTNHHALFKFIAVSDHLLLLLNGLLLLFIVAVPFSTSLLSTYLQHSESPPSSQFSNSTVATAIYGGVYVLIAIFYNLLWRYAAHERRLIGKTVHQRIVQRITDGYKWGPILYLVAFALAFVSVPASLLVNLGLAIFFAVLPLHRPSAP